MPIVPGEGLNPGPSEYGASSLRGHSIITKRINSKICTKIANLSHSLKQKNGYFIQFFRKFLNFGVTVTKSEIPIPLSK